MTVNVATRYDDCKRFATPAALALIAGCYTVLWMDTNDEIRRRRLEQLCAREGGVRVVAAESGLNWQALDQIIKKVPLPAKADGTRSARALGDPAARKLEQVYDLGEGWFDWPFDEVDFKSWAELDQFQRAVVQGQMIAAIAEARKGKIHAGAKKAAVSNKKVEKHYKALPQGAAEAAERRASTSTRVRPFGEREPDLFDRRKS